MAKADNAKPAKRARRPSLLGFAGVTLIVTGLAIAVAVRGAPQWWVLAVGSAGVAAIWLILWWRGYDT